MSVYRVDRGHIAVLSGVLFIVAGALAFLAFVLHSRLAGSLVIALLIVALLVIIRPPKVATLDEHGLRARKLRVRWLDVDHISLESGQLVLSGETSDHRLSLSAIGRRAPELVREAYDRMNTAHGYTRWEPN